jgi:hypothetical protein
MQCRETNAALQDSITKALIGHEKYLKVRDCRDEHLICIPDQTAQISEPSSCSLVLDAVKKPHALLAMPA